MFQPRSADADVMIRLRLAPEDARYAGNLVPGSKALEIFADLETEIALREGGDEGLCVGYESVEFKAPLRVGDYVEAYGRVVRRGNTSRKIEAHLYKVVSVDDGGSLVPMDAPVLAATCLVTIVVNTQA